MKIAIADLVSNSYFPATAAVELGYFKAEGLDMTLEHIFPVGAMYKALRDGRVDFVAGSAIGIPIAFPDFEGAKMLSAMTQGCYWALVMRSELGAKRGDLVAVKGRRIGAAPLVELALKRLIREAGIDADRDKVEIGPIPGPIPPGASFGVTAVKALQAGTIDGLWANCMAAEVAVRSGTGTLVLDVRRGDGPKAAFHYTMPVLVTTEKLLAERPDVARRATRAMVATVRAIKADIGKVAEVGRRLFTADETEKLTAVISRDLPYYDPRLGEDFVRDMNRFACDVGLSRTMRGYQELVATEMAPLWTA
ncbi:MAG: ABC transporter substrate-binding protein [Alphaproteobacteria bacterium]|nr:ABC transporter substrate-binding protein [Alphaproteobacteria bacterium]